MMIPLTAIQIRYMRVLYQLGSDRTVKLSEVAEVLKVSKPECSQYVLQTAAVWVDYAE